MTDKSMYEACKRCSEARAEQDYERALRCSLCDGKGFVPRPDAHPCNRCGGSLYTPEGTVSEQVAYGIEHLEITGAYHSEGLNDLHRYTFSLCERCLRAMFQEWKIRPKVELVTLHDIVEKEIEFEEDQRLWEEGEWRHTGGHALARMQGLCNATKACGKPAAYSVKQSGYLGDECRCEEHKDHDQNCLNAELLPFVPWSVQKQIEEDLEQDG